MVTYGADDADDDSSYWYDLSGFLTPYQDIWAGFYFGDFQVDGYMDTSDASDTYAYVECHRGCGDFVTSKQTAIHYDTDNGNFNETLYFNISDAFTYVVFVIYLYDEDSLAADEYIDIDGTNSGINAEAWA